jgi:hypothetical protein
VKHAKMLTPWRQEMAEFRLAFTKDEWDVLKAAGLGSTSRMQHILREALCFYLALDDGEFSNLSVSILEKTLMTLHVLQAKVENALAEAEPKSPEC